MFLNCTSTWDFNVNTAFLLYVKWMIWFKKILQAKLQSTTRNGLVYRRIFFISNVQNRYNVSRFISKVYRWQLTPPRFINLKKDKLFKTKTTWVNFGHCSSSIRCSQIQNLNYYEDTTNISFSRHVECLLIFDVHVTCCKFSLIANNLKYINLELELSLM